MPAIVGAIVYSYRKSAVNDVITDGELVVKRRPILKIREQDVLEKSAKKPSQGHLTESPKTY